MVSILIGLAIGFGLPIQTSINSRLKDAFGSPFWSSLISFAIGTVGLAGVVLVQGERLIPTLATISSLPWWLWLGGIFGVIYLTSNILLFPQLGAVQTVIFPVLGQILMGLLIDNGGWFDTARNPLTTMRVIGALLVIAGVLITVLYLDTSLVARTSVCR
ncbi:DMT family transporter [Lacticaseibacillus manihotivorans]|uniref:DMT family transporter n=1 Tax=Lacticaseibacillus manihotivorans TaxID=88233 RepID=UPI000A4F0245|nr:DMT family transporter [Lacticaseibacillus manihotivorans]